MVTYILCFVACHSSHDGMTESGCSVSVAGSTCFISGRSASVAVEAGINGINGDATPSTGADAAGRTAGVSAGARSARLIVGTSCGGISSGAGVPFGGLFRRAAYVIASTRPPQ